jgi:branched-chain amino acid transport system permease protein
VSGQSELAAPVGRRPLSQLGEGLSRFGPLFALAAMLVVLALPLIGINAFWQLQIILMVSYGLVVCGVNLSFGYAGELALGQVGVFATGAYLSGAMAMHGFNDLLLCVIAAALAGAAIGLITGLPGLRIGGWALAMTSFFFVILIPDLSQVIPGIGGDVGLFGIPQPKLFGVTLTSTGVYIAAIVILAAWVALFRNFVLSRHGIALKMLRQSPDLAAAMGSSVYRLKLMAYVTGAIPAAIGGVLYTMSERSVSPSILTFSLAIGVIAGSVIGGTDSIYGALVGGAILEYVNFRTTSFVAYSTLVYGAVLVIGGVLVAGGLAKGGRRLVAQFGFTPPEFLRREAVEAPAERTAVLADVDALPGLRVTVREVSKSFGAVRALTDVSLSAEPGKITALIGPNGSGKTTLLNVIAGVYPADSGQVLLDGTPLHGAAHQNARAGVSRTFQTPIIPRGLLAWEVIAAARYQAEYCSIAQAALSTPKARRLGREDRAVSLAVLEQLGIDHLVNEPAISLSLGHRRLLEVGRALARNSGVILLDEAASGLDEGDIDILAAALRNIKALGITAVLVEHNLPLVLEVADVIHVLNLGRLIASGPPDQIRDDPQVAESYLGKRHPDRAAEETTT